MGSTQTQDMDDLEISVPVLPYAAYALAPHMSNEALEHHCGMQHLAYVVNLNKLIKGTKYDRLNLNDIIKAEPAGDICSAAAQVWNHTFFRHCLTPKGGGTPGGALADAINLKWGSFDKFKLAFQTSAAYNFDSALTWLVKKADGSVDIINIAATSTPLTTDDMALLCVDVWELDSYSDYRNLRPKFVEAFFKSMVNWDFAEKNFAVNMVHTVPALSCTTHELALQMSHETFEYHCGMHHLAYVINMNKLIKDTEYEGLSLVEVLKNAPAGDIYNATAQVSNHTLFWQCMKPNGGRVPSGALADAINLKWGSFDAFKHAFQMSAVDNNSSTWTWLIKKLDGTVYIANMGAADTPLIMADKALLCINVEEHVDYRNLNPKFIETFLNKLVNWDFVAKNYG